MLTSLVLQVQAREGVKLPSHLGRASHALLLRLVQGYDAALAEALHESSQAKPFTVSNLIMGWRKGAELQLTVGIS